MSEGLIIILFMLVPLAIGIVGLTVATVIDSLKDGNEPGG